ncbi:MAG TPA: PQQ-binding-like beta-propeller repeat protein [Candidatus Paceibacterota bacterium]|nr:PQQ-binding-like beta-propeller repeat protein [Candidatus Paceibacterota bacterium]HRZ93981.1 PQQ-binding-like beta-propeller repeat protein [Candidatus Paceibacterota bacterium]
MRWWCPAAMILLALGAWAWLRAAETGYGEFIAALILILTVFGLGFWYIFLTGLRWRTRFLLTGAAVAAIASIVLGLWKYTRIDGSIGGSGLPRLAWKWSPPRDAAAGALVVAFKPAAMDAIGNVSFPQFLGPDRSGIVHGVTLERDWSISPPRELWRRPVGVGWSAFAVSGGRAITQEQRGEQELTVAYDLATGNPVWAHTNRVRFREASGGDGPRATPTVRDGKVYVMGATGILDCLDENTGNRVWTRDVLREYNLQNIIWGKSCSPLLVGRLVVVTGGKEREKSLLAFAAENGEPVWQSGRDCASYSSAAVATLGGQPQILIVNGHSVTGHHPADGRILWEYPWPGNEAKVAQPLPLEPNLVLVATGYGIGGSLLRIEPAAAEQWTVTELWKNRNLKPKFSSPVRRGNYVYGLDDGILVCLDWLTGKRVWKEGKYGYGQILLVEDVLLIQSEAGDVVLAEAAPDGHRELARLPALPSKTWNNPVLAGDLLLVRNDLEAACYRLPLATGGASTRPAANASH